MTIESEQRQVLDMLEDGHIDASDAERLLERLGEGSPTGPNAPEPRSTREGTYLRVIVRTEDGDDVDVRLPLKLLATGVELEKLLPEAAQDAIDSTGIELSELSNVRGDLLVEAVRELEVDLTGHDGSLVQIRCE